MPVLFARRKPDDVAWVNFLDTSAPDLHPAAAGCDDQGLAQGMGVPSGPRTDSKGDAGAGDARRVGSLEERIDAYAAGEIFGRPFALRL